MAKVFTAKKKEEKSQDVTLQKNRTVIVIDNILISDDVVEKQFVCDLAKCKGGCCEDGDAGPRLDDE